MRFIKQVKPIEIKRTFVITDLVAHIYGGRRLGNNCTFLKNISEKEFEGKLADTKRKILKLEEGDFDKLVCPEYPKRPKAYNIGGKDPILVYFGVPKEK